MAVSKSSPLPTIREKGGEEMRVRKDPISAIALSATNGVLAEMGYRLVAVNDGRVSLLFGEARYAFIVNGPPAPNGDNARGKMVTDDIVRALQRARMDVKRQGDHCVEADGVIVSFVG